MGNVLNEKVIDFDNLKEKIKTLIAIDNADLRNEIVNKIKELEYIDIIGTAGDGIETYNKIVNLKPEIVFAQYNLENMSGYDHYKKFKRKAR